ncbi:hypothetical protein SAMN05216174_12114 [Actinokineospora iranica]|uniref:Uncharacterized protein n=2 Tax=Actinokineospora iranica TaxID=1271860 RepID=A0A1G6YCN6_9PSEU|nr:hypothetical protein SAMN05216174_12114 [Actinokineospora iranica]
MGVLMIDRDGREEYVSSLISELLPFDTAFAVLGCARFRNLVDVLGRLGRDDAAAIEGLLREAVVELEPHKLEWLAEGAESPAGFLVSRVRRAYEEQS